ncbi:hypothetical protein GGR26_001449 [Lewinella marina]|uniref:hypothetical protein n=1 Tax=Neolewinella marina TaxID=438751 RepID=UPI00117A5BFA|nr:hypothetical protein [Neolewinella marina]NJB85704.1 hypothetical protein [Neolewinella marina]
MSRKLYPFLTLLYSPWILAQEGVDVDPELNPEAAWYEHPTLWILLAVGLVVALLVLRKQSRRPGRN